MEHPITIRMVHILEIYHNIVLSSHIIGDILVDNQPQKPIEQSQVDFFVHFFESGFQNDQGLSLGDVPDAVEVVDTLAPFVDEEWRGFGVCGFYPVGE